MQRSPPADHRSRLQPPGQRWGFGAHSVVPYLMHTLANAPGADIAATISNPVFPQMEKALRDLQRRH